jgi:cell division protein FtsA
MPNNYICALDIGSSKIAATLVVIKKKNIINVFFDSVSSKGVKRGAIVDSISLVDSVSKLLRKLKAESGINIKFISVNISGQDIVTKHSRAIVPLAERGNKVITAADLKRVNDQARILGSSLEDEIIHLVPYSYAIDSKQNIANPVGLYSHRLEGDLYLICSKLSHIQNLSRAINQSGYEIKDVYFCGLATSKTVFDKESEEGLNLLCDIGSDISELLVFRNGSLKDIEVLLIGGDDLTMQLQDALKIPFDLAEDIKRSYGIIVDPQQIPEDKEILVKKSNMYKPIKQKLVSEIITSKSKLICSTIKNAVEKKVPLYEINNFVVTGKTVLLEGMLEMLESTLNIPVKLGRIKNPQIPLFVKEHNELSGQKYLTYLTCLGMICEEMHDKTIGISSNQKLIKNPIFKAINRFKEVYQEYF